MIIVFNKRPPTALDDIASDTWAQLIVKTCTWGDWVTGCWARDGLRKIAEGVRKRLEDGNRGT